VLAYNLLFNATNLTFDYQPRNSLLFAKRFPVPGTIETRGMDGR
jgi:hypothetical protein